MLTMKSLKYIIYRDGDYYVSQCLNIEVASFGSTIDEALANLKKLLSYIWKMIMRRVIFTKSVNLCWASCYRA